MFEDNYSMPSSHHPFRARFFSGLLLFIIAFVGMIVTVVHQDAGFIYWCYATPFFGFLGLFLSLYLRQKKHSHAVAFIWHELLHWVGLLMAAFLVAEFVRIGLLSRFAASLVMITVLSLTLFLAGIYIEFTFMILGLVLGCLVILTAFFAEYFYFVSIPLVIIGIALLFFFTRNTIYQK